MKRVKAACIQQTLIFSQKEGHPFSQEYAAKLNRDEVEKYKAGLDRSKTRYKILDESTDQDGSITLKIVKQYNDTASVGDYF